jgi:hypothetical protein
VLLSGIISLAYLST